MRIWIFGIVLALTSAGLAQSPAQVQFPKKIEQTGEFLNGVWDCGTVLLAGQPTEATLRRLKEKGFTLVVCFRTTREMANRQSVPFDEAELVGSLGMQYLHLPMSGPDGPEPDNPEIVAKLAAALKGNEGKTLIHCTVGWRASYVWTAYLVRYQGMDLNEAIRHGSAMEVDNPLDRLLVQPVTYSLKQATPATAPAFQLVTEASNWATIVTPQRAQFLLGQGATLLDVRSNYMEYLDGHFKGSIHMDANTLRGPLNGLPVQFRTNAEVAETLRLAGVTHDKPTILYGSAGDILNTTMTAYALEKLGAKNIFVVDGGSPACAATNLVDKIVPINQPAQFKLKKGDHVTATLSDIKSYLADGKATLIDARPPAQYTGDQNLWMRNGHIPGAINIFWRTLMQEGNAHAFRSRAEIEKIFADKGIRPDQDVIVYCGTGKEASLIWMLLKRELGFGKVRLYEGAWTEYASRTTLPMVVGANPR